MSDIYLAATKASGSRMADDGGLPLGRSGALDTVAFAAELLFIHGQATEHTIAAAERLALALGISVRVLARWGELIVEVPRSSSLELRPAMPFATDMGKVLGVMRAIDQVCEGKLAPEDARSALEEAAAKHTSASTPWFVLFGALGSAALGVIFGETEAVSLLLMALSAGLGALFRRWLAKISRNPFVQPLGAALLAGAFAAAVGRLQLPGAASSLIALCPCMILVPGPHILNGAIDMARARVALGLARLTFAGLLILAISIGLLVGLKTCGATLGPAALSFRVPFAADVIAVGCAAAAFATFFSMPWRLLPLPVAIGMLAHAARWAAIFLAGADVTTGAFVACLFAGLLVTPLANHLHLPHAGLGFSAVVAMMPGFFLFHAASDLSELVSDGSRAPAELLAAVVSNGATAFFIILAMALGLIFPRMAFAHFRSPT